MIHTLLSKVDVLAKKVDKLEKKATDLNPKKDSRNSSQPPSHDHGRIKKNQSLRTKSGKKKGGQPGHKGSTLQINTTPDKVVEQIPCYCENCGYDLEEIDGLLKEKRQVIDLPPIEPIYTEYRTYRKTCLCGHQNQGIFPSNVKAPIQYGESIDGLAAYFSVRQYLPYKRMKECFNDVFGLKISEATLVNSMKRTALKALPVYNRIKENISKSNVVGSDETGIKINGEKGWFWVWKNDKNTYITVSKSRGYKVIENEFPNGFPNSILESDCLPAQLKTNAKNHQICLAHLQRDIKYLIDLYDDQWSKKVYQLFVDSLKLKKELSDYRADNPNRYQILRTFDELLAFDIEKQPDKVKVFHKRLIKHRQYVFPFLFYQEVSADNNASERAIRNIKVKQKISNQFVNLNAAMNFAVLRSIIDTSIKNGANILQCLKLAAQMSS